ncbi:MAG: hypothetical protein KBS42_05025 [Bacteroidales bacterium]|nr:hypothetical protein [Candidatus Colicola coprequi]
MSKVDYIKPIEALHGKLQKSDNVGFAKRQIEGTKYTFTRKPSYNHEANAAELAARTMFGNVAKWTANILSDPNKIQTYMTKFKQSGKSGTMTLRSFVFKDVYNNYDEHLAKMEGDA